MLSWIILLTWGIVGACLGGPLGFVGGLLVGFLILMYLENS